MNVREEMIEMRRKFIDNLRRLNPNLAMELSELDKLNIAIEAIDNLVGVPGTTEVSPSEFASLTIIEATQVYLGRTGKPISIPDLAKVLAYGSAGKDRGNTATEHRLAQSLAYHAPKGKVVVKDGIVSLPGWDSNSR